MQRICCWWLLLLPLCDGLITVDVLPWTEHAGTTSRSTALNLNFGVLPVLQCPARAGARPSDFGAAVAHSPDGAAFDVHLAALLQCLALRPPAACYYPASCPQTALAIRVVLYGASDPVDAEEPATDSADVCEADPSHNTTQLNILVTQLCDGLLDHPLKDPTSVGAVPLAVPIQVGVPQSQARRVHWAVMY